MPTEDRLRAPSEELSPDLINLTKAYPEEALAEAEAQRLNELNEGHWQYFVLVARWVDESDRDKSDNHTDPDGRIEPKGR
jgi:hypothetical protein